MIGRYGGKPERGRRVSFRIAAARAPDPGRGKVTESSSADCHIEGW